MELSELVRTHREAAGLTRLQLADLAQVGKTMLFKLEHGEEGLNFRKVLQVLRVLDIELTAQSRHLAKPQILTFHTDENSSHLSA